MPVTNFWYIYKITNLLNNRSYIGQKCIRNNEINPLKDNYMGSGLYIRSSIKKHGKENFKKEILIDGLTSQFAANIFEEYFIKKEETLSPFGYNLKSSCIQGGIISEEVRKKLSKGRKGKVVSLETRKKLSEAKKGHVVSQQTRLKLSKANKGKKSSEETRKKLSESHKGIHPSEETRKKQSIAAKGKNTWSKGTHPSEETKEKRLKSRKGFKFSKESKEKMSKAKRGIKHSKETIERMSKAKLEKKRGPYKSKKTSIE
jgi:hypothetical protein